MRWWGITPPASVQPPSPEEIQENRRFVTALHAFNLFPTPKDIEAQDQALQQVRVCICFDEGFVLLMTPWISGPGASSEAPSRVREPEIYPPFARATPLSEQQ